MEDVTFFPELQSYLEGLAFLRVKQKLYQGIPLLSFITGVCR